jgi:hypothetical protein
MSDLPFGLRPSLVGSGLFEVEGARIRLTLPATPAGYADAQLDDYQGLPRQAFPRRPPLRLSLEARASHPTPAGTLGFGFWNDPFAFGLGGGVRRLPAAPRALWFFYGSPPNQLAFAREAAGQGWLAASLEGPSLPDALLLPLAVGAFALSRLPLGGRLAAGAIQRVVKAAEVSLAQQLDAWHRYELDWGATEAQFWVDEQLVLRTAPPRPPLGFVAWIDNQFAALSPERGIRFGVLPTAEPQWLDIRGLSIGA